MDLEAAEKGPSVTPGQLQRLEMVSWQGRLLACSSSRITPCCSVARSVASPLLNP